MNFNHIVKNFLKKIKFPDGSFDYAKVAVVIIFALYFFSYAIHSETIYNTPNFIDSIINSVNLAIHEAGHACFFFFGNFIYVLGGSLLQVLIPIIFAGYFFIKSENFSGSLLLFWVGQNLINVSVYAGDAVVMQLPLLGGDNSGHDWHYLLSVTGLLDYTKVISGVIYIVGFLLIALATALSFFFARKDNIQNADQL